LTKSQRWPGVARRRRVERLTSEGHEEQSADGEPGKSELSGRAPGSKRSGATKRLFESGVHEARGGSREAAQVVRRRFRSWSFAARHVRREGEPRHAQAGHRHRAEDRRARETSGGVLLSGLLLSGLRAAAFPIKGATTCPTTGRQRATAIAINGKWIM
jgi:hypothetical protein